jgi:hypothetical protein
VRAASVPSFLPERLKDSGWAIAVRGRSLSTVLRRWVGLITERVPVMAGVG